MLAEEVVGAVEMVLEVLLGLVVGILVPLALLAGLEEVVGQEVFLEEKEVS